MNRVVRTAFAPFDPRGRLSAPAFRHAVIRLLLTAAGLVCLSIWLASLGLRWPGILTFASTFLVVLAALAQTTRRLHDRDRTGWWLGLYLLMEGMTTLPLEDAVETDPVPVTALVVTMLGYFAWFCKETLLRPGTTGPNRYGPAPSDPTG